jgi:NAD(P)-dependent dehydrogenase (short-subunit alcohol dehydrogenase family)
MPSPQLPDTLQPKSLAGRRALVTGAAKRIGRGIAVALARAGADVAITYNRSATEALETVAALRGFNVRAEAFACDLHDPQAIRATVQQAGEWAAAEGAPALDVLINNAGAFETAALEEVTPEQWDSMFRTNTRAPLLVAQAALPFLRASQGGGRIVNIGSLGGLHPWATHAHYCASKAALHMLTQTMAKSWAPRVAVNCVAPGMIATGDEASEGYAHFIEKTPMGRNGRVEDVAEVVLFLAAATTFLTGQVIAVDGGLGL